MKIGLRILLGYFLIVGLAAWFLLTVFVQQVKPGVRATQEDALVDTAHLLAVILADDVKAGTLSESVVISRINALRKRTVDVRIAGFSRPDVALRFYITDTRGIVIYDSAGQDVGRDYSRWNDVYLTLRGKYGARSTRAGYDENSTVMHVAAPVKDGDRIIGVLTVAKPNLAVQPFVERSQKVIRERGALLLIMSLLIGAAFAWWLSHSLNKLMLYISAVEEGKKVALPDLGNNEFGRLGRALAAMRAKLEGKEYVEELMHTMAHELKSPIAAIQGSAELMREEMPAHERAHFLSNILNQNARQKQLIDKLLALIRVEKQQHLDAPGQVSLRELAAQVQDDCAARLAARDLTLSLTADDLTVPGDALLLRQALGNLLDNAIDFSPQSGKIALTVSRLDHSAVITVRDEGEGIPPFAQERLFERFYSLPRPDGARSTGLGLPFVREAVALHRGSVSVANGEHGGAVATVVLPLA
ncbi:two-component system sensor histidine kinase CreC [Massilia sp. PAMC28688]|uniref:two-component system sensor histidine kinase CreC n=1 Tax=Massilia sp. PAMC28688 TaxID=2861283 RepID=UPI001C62C0BC|nr:two-component system sensor histidine kinase CreC [Massilia sp. PAMC28688]QYF94853.1 two-component system sensor histidine kinase CreC [Massilia sp. PAMC28688]